jgi:hypothetical protein
MHLKIFFSRTAGPILNRLGTNHPWVKGNQVSSNRGDSLSSRGDNSKRVKHTENCKISPLEPAASAGQI